ncbi:hypothetical protein D3C78_449910 [compost metagenome]
MKDPNDILTIDALEAPRRGRPKSGNALSNAEKQRRYRERLKAEKVKDEDFRNQPLFHACTGEVLQQRKKVYLLNASHRARIIHALRMLYLVPGKGWTDVAAAQAEHLVTMGTGISEDQLPPELFRSRD